MRRLVCALSAVTAIVVAVAVTDEEAVAASGRRAYKTRYLRASKKACQLLKGRSNIDKQDQFGRNALYEECERGNEIAVDLLLRSGANVNKPDPWGWTPLHVAAWNGWPLVVERLLLSGAKKEAEDHWRQTPLFLATKKRHRSVIRVLRRAGARY